MKLVIAQMKHETNTFSPVPTPLARFARNGGAPPEGDAAIAAYRGTGSAIAAFIELAEAAGASVTVPIAASAWPSGPVHDTAFEHIASRIVEAVAAGCDGVLLDLHGAMVTERFDDGEGELLRRIRAAAPGIPIGVALDMHTNLYDAMGEHADVLAGYQTYPHVDMHETGLRAGRALLAQLGGRARPTMAWGRQPMLPHVMRQGTDDSPNRELQARCREMEAQGALCASVFVGFPNADIEYGGLSAVVVTDNDAALARRLCDELLERAWSARAQFVYRPEPLAQSMARAQSLAAARPAGAGPVVLLDHSDNCASGGTMDTMTVLGAMLDAGLRDAAAFAVFDPAAVRQLIAAGVGAQVTLPLGGKLDMPALHLKGEPRTVSGRVRLICDGGYRNLGPMGRGEANSMGPTVVLDTGGVEIVVISNHVEPHDLAAFTAVGIDPRRKQYLMLKSRVHWRAGLKALANAVVECNGSGVCTSDYAALGLRRVRRPIYPLDAL
ncbi:MAG: M81 family metallopeptidase [Burkholderiaceae bacterium]|nr:MAG: M81 family metallopeptidase [Burkholderiaceae bacterium]MBE7425812.1 M81 family metallopeptidase [Ideonella sp.]MCC7286703.1 M81 family metallopeptidase [Burkholderiaceae bacterium]